MVPHKSAFSAPLAMENANLCEFKPLTWYLCLALEESRETFDCLQLFTHFVDALLGAKPGAPITMFCSPSLLPFNVQDGQAQSWSGPLPPTVKLPRTEEDSYCTNMV